jgi:hypothetical protein
MAAFGCCNGLLAGGFVTKNDSTAPAAMHIALSTTARDS